MKLGVRLLTSSFLFLSSLACTQWGGNVLNDHAWWACPDRNSSCTPENAALTFTQMDNTLKGVERDLTRAAAHNHRKTAELTLAIDAAWVARSRITSPSVWDDHMADYVQAVVTAERAANKTLPHKSTYWGS